MRKIERLSASQVSSFDPSTTWGCNRRWWFRNIAGKKEPQNKSMEEGERVHAEIEHYLKTGVNGMGPVALSGFEFMPKPMAPGMLVEHLIADGELACEGVPFTGKIDVFLDGPVPRIMDWKTSSNVMLYKKQPSALRGDTQVLTYAMWAMNTRPIEQVDVELVFLQTGRSRYSDNSQVTLSREEVERGWAAIGGTVKEMLDVAAAARVEDIAPTESHCTVGRSQCPHFNYCPRKGVFSMASLLDDLFAAPTTSATPAPIPAAEEPTVQASEAEQIELPLTPTSEVVNPLADSPEPPKRGPGRPPGAKNKPKVADLAPMPPARVTMPTAEPAPPSKPAPVAATTTFTKVSVRHGLTINLGNFQSAKVEVEAEALVGASFESAVEAVREQVLAALKRETAPYLAQAAQVAEKK